jgi:DNA topoisomerase VI subunit A
MLNQWQIAKNIFTNRTELNLNIDENGLVFNDLMVEQGFDTKLNNEEEFDAKAFLFSLYCAIGQKQSSIAQLLFRVQMVL